jgi:hypothetical protein
MRSNGQQSELHFGSVGANFDIRRVFEYGPICESSNSNVYDKKPVITRWHADAMVKFEFDPNQLMTTLFFS